MGSHGGPDTEMTVIIVSYLCCLLISILYVVFSAIMLCYKNSLPWIFLTVVSLILQIVLTSIFGGLKGEIAGEIGLKGTIGIVLAVVTQVYCLLCVWSARQKMLQKGAGQ